MGDAGDDDGGPSSGAPATTTTAAPPTVESLVVSVSAERIGESLQALVGPRSTPEERAATRQVIRDELAAAGVEVVEEPFGDDGLNLIGRIDGDDRSAPPIVVSAHYDTVPGSPGADDNASGVAAALELARVFGRAKPPAPIELGIAPLEGNGECLADTRRSDHAPYWDAGVPAVFLTDTANFRNPNYHEPSDTLDTVDQALVAEVTRATAAAVADVAGFDA